MLIKQNIDNKLSEAMSIAEELCEKELGQWNISDKRAMNNCPFHEDSTPSFEFYLGSDGEVNYHCFGCKCGGHLVGFVKQALNCDYFTACQWLLEHGYTTPSESFLKKLKVHDCIQKFMKWSNEELRSSGSAILLRQYLSERGVSEKFLHLYPIGVYPMRDEILHWASANGIDNEVVNECLLLRTPYNLGGYIVFAYRDAKGFYTSLKIRNVVRERFYGAQRKMYWIGAVESDQSIKCFGVLPAPELMEMFTPRILLVEGEFDVLAIVDKLNTCINSDDNKPQLCSDAVICVGSGSNIAKAVQHFTNSGTNPYVWLDNDKAGNQYLEEIVAQNPYVGVVRLNNYETGEDPASYVSKLSAKFLAVLVDMWKTGTLGIEVMLSKFVSEYKNCTLNEERHVLQEAFDYAAKLQPVDKDRFIRMLAEGCEITYETLVTASQRSGNYKLSLQPTDFGTYKRCISKDGTERWEKISSVVLRNAMEVSVDDGETIEGYIQFEALLLGKAPIIVRMKNEEYVDSKLFNVAIVNAVGIEAHTSNRNLEDLRSSLLAFTEGSVQRKSCRSTLGWDKNFNKFYLANKVITVNGIEEFTDTSIMLPEQPSYLHRYIINAEYSDDDVSLARDVLINDILKVYPYKITLPYLAYIFSSILYNKCTFVKPSLLVLCGATGSFKTSFTQVMMSFMGDFVDASFESWTSTANAIAKAGYSVKDLGFVVDDLKPVNVNPHSFLSFVQATADRQGRGRMGVDTNLKKVYFPRGNVIITAEDVGSYAESSARARLLKLNIDKCGDTEHLSRAQAMAHVLPALMVKWITYFIQNPVDIAAVREEFVALRNEYAPYAHHTRTAETAAFMTWVWRKISELYDLRFLDDEFYKSVKLFMASMSAETKSEVAAVVFVETLKGLIDADVVSVAKSVLGVGNDWITRDNAIGWMDVDNIYILPSLAISKVNEQLVKEGRLKLNYSRTALFGLLYKEGFIQKNRDGFTFRKRKPWNGEQPNVLIFNRKALLGDDFVFAESNEAVKACITDTEQSIMKSA